MCVYVYACVWRFVLYGIILVRKFGPKQKILAPPSCCVPKIVEITPARTNGLEIIFFLLFLNRK